MTLTCDLWAKNEFQTWVLDRDHRVYQIWQPLAYNHLWPVVRIKCSCASYVDQRRPTAQVPYAGLRYYDQQQPTRIQACSKQLSLLRQWIHDCTRFPSYCRDILQDDLLVHLAQQPVLLQSHNLNAVNRYIRSLGLALVSTPISSGLGLGLMCEVTRVSSWVSLRQGQRMTTCESQERYSLDIRPTKKRPTAAEFDACWRQRF